MATIRPGRGRQQGLRCPGQQGRGLGGDGQGTRRTASHRPVSRAGPWGMAVNSDTFAHFNNPRFCEKYGIFNKYDTTY